VGWLPCPFLFSVRKAVNEPPLFLPFPLKASTLPLLSVLSDSFYLPFSVALHGSDSRSFFSSFPATRVQFTLSSLKTAWEESSWLLLLPFFISFHADLKCWSGPLFWIERGSLLRSPSLFLLIRAEERNFASLSLPPPPPWMREYKVAFFLSPPPP